MTRRPPPPVQLGFAERGVAQPQQVPEFVQRHRFEVDAARRALRRHRPREAGVEEDVGFDNRAVGGVDQEAGRAEHAIEVRPIEKSQRRAAVHHAGRRGGHALELEAHGGRRDRLPRGGGARNGAAQVAGRHGAGIGVGHEIADRRPPGHVDDAAVDRRAQLQVRGDRRRRRRRSRSGAEQETRGAPHRAAILRPRARRFRTRVSDTGLRRASPRTMGLPAGSTTGGVDQGGARCRVAHHAVDALREPGRHRQARAARGEEQHREIAARERRRAGKQVQVPADLPARNGERQFRGGTCPSGP